MTKRKRKCPHLQPQVRADVPYRKDTPVSHTTTQYSHTMERVFYPSREGALLDLAYRAEELTGKRVSPDRFRHMVHHAYASTWQAVWSDALLVMVVDVLEAHNQAALGKGAELIDHICAFCESGFITASTDDLRWAGWRRRGDYWVCPDCAGEDQ